MSSYLTSQELQKLEAATQELKAVAERYGFDLRLIKDRLGTWYYHPEFPPLEECDGIPVRTLPDEGSWDHRRYLYVYYVTDPHHFLVQALQKSHIVFWDSTSTSYPGHITVVKHRYDSRVTPSHPLKFERDAFWAGLKRTASQRGLQIYLFKVE